MVLIRPIASYCHLTFKACVCDYKRIRHMDWWYLLLFFKNIIELFTHYLNEQAAGHLQTVYSKYDYGYFNYPQTLYGLLILRQTLSVNSSNTKICIFSKNPSRKIGNRNKSWKNQIRTKSINLLAILTCLVFWAGGKEMHRSSHENYVTFYMGTLQKFRTDLTW